MKKLLCAHNCYARHLYHQPMPPSTAYTHNIHAPRHTRDEQDEHYTTLVAKAPVWSGCRLERVTRRVPGVTYSSPSTTSNTYKTAQQAIHVTTD
jgi:hypothetical protein